MSHQVSNLIIKIYILWILIGLHDSASEKREKYWSHFANRFVIGYKTNSYRIEAKLATFLILPHQKEQYINVLC